MRGTLTALVADLCRLDRCDDGFNVVRGAIRRGELSRTGQPYEIGPFGNDYLRKLKWFLRRTGYR